MFLFSIHPIIQQNPLPIDNHDSVKLSTSGSCEFNFIYLHKVKIIIYTILTIFVKGKGWPTFQKQGKHNLQ